MAQKVNIASRTSNRKRGEYLTKRILIRAARAAGKRAAQRAMQVMGYIVTMEDGWVVKKYSNGHIEKIEPIEPFKKSELTFD